MYKIELQWKEFNVNLQKVNEAIPSICNSYAGNQANSVLELWFSEEPSDQEKADIQAYWDALTDQSAEAQSYKSAADIETERLAKKASAEAKLIALGLSQDEVKAILG
jgi:hypothetical protein